MSQRPFQSFDIEIFQARLETVKSFQGSLIPDTQLRSWWLVRVLTSNVGRQCRCYEQTVKQRYDHRKTDRQTKLFKELTDDTLQVPDGTKYCQDRQSRGDNRH